MGRIHDDAGAVAILVALSVSTFLLGFAALAVDFGQVYTRQGELQSVADVAALAGATELPDAAKARRKAVLTLCADANRLTEWDEDVCPDPAGPLPGWASDGDDGNGEVFLYDRDDGPPQGGDGFFQPDEQIDDPGDPATAIRVLLPPLLIEFGLGRSIADNITVSKAATARIGTPEGAGMLPFAVTTEDLRLGAEKEICVLDPAAEPALPDPPANPIFVITDPLIAVYAAPTDGTQLILRKVPFIGRDLPTDDPVVFIDGQDRGAPENATPDAITIRLPDLSSGSHRVWVQSDTQVTNFASILVTGGAAAPGDDACQGTSRGVLDIGRSENNDDPNTVLSENLKHGIEPRAHRIFDFPDQINRNLLDPVLNLLRCRTLGLPPLPVILDFVLSTVGLGGVFSPDINCVTTRASGFAEGLTTGLLDANGGNPGRLLQRCSDEEAAAGGRTIDGTDLFRGDALVTDGGVLDKDDLATGNVQRGLIKNDAFRCPRLGMVPVIQPGVLNIVDDDYPIVDFTYVWIDDDAEGLIFNADDTLRGVRFHIIDPGFFNQTVTGSLSVGPYRGENFPKEIVLVRDIGDQP